LTQLSVERMVSEYREVIEEHSRAARPAQVAAAAAKILRHG
jgi:hypothetical protein